MGLFGWVRIGSFAGSLGGDGGVLGCLGGFLPAMLLFSLLLLFFLFLGDLFHNLRPELISSIRGRLGLGLDSITTRILGHIILSVLCQEEAWVEGDSEEVSVSAD